MRNRLWILILSLLVLLYLFKTEVLWLTHPDKQLVVRLIDVSHHQGAIQWRSVLEDGVHYAWIKATEGGDWVDPNFERNRTEAREAGVQWGGYHFFTFCRPGAEQAEHFLKIMAGRFGDLPPAVDIETGGNCQDKPTPQELSASLADFLRMVESRTHRPTVIYVIESQVPALFEQLSLPDRPLWVRNMTGPPTLPDGRKAMFWQYHSRAWVFGIQAFVDRNVFLGSDAEFEYFLRQKL